MIRKRGDPRAEKFSVNRLDDDPQKPAFELGRILFEGDLVAVQAARERHHGGDLNSYRNTRNHRSKNFLTPGVSFVRR